MFDRILVVCTGNICRSPFGEALLQQLCPNKVVHSAGTGALVDHAADATATKIAAQMDVDISTHRARQLTSTMCQEYDLILVMEDHHRRYIANTAPAAVGKTMLFGKWMNDKKINDPYRLSEEYFQLVFEEIWAAAELWKKKLN